MINKKILLLCAFSVVSMLGTAQNVTRSIKNYFEQNESKLGFEKGDLDSWKITDQHTDDKFGITYVYVTQQYEGIEIYNAVANFAVKDGKSVLSGNRFKKGITANVNSSTPAINELDAIRNAAKEIGISDNFTITRSSEYNDRYIFFDAPELSRTAIPVKLVYVEKNDELRLSYDLSVELPSGGHWWSIRIDALTGNLIDKVDWVVSCQFDHDHDAVGAVCSNASQAQVNAPALPPSTDVYNVFAIPVESPNHGPRTVLTGPYNPGASPFGWHDDDGVAGAEYTITRGNNVYASEDSNDDNTPGYSPDGGPGLVFDFPLNLNQPGQGFWDAAITNLFYMNNIMHDVWYHYGFDEASGNFQDNNYGNGGSSSDRVNADAQDGSGTNNANFATPPDGSNPRMQMYLWNAGGTPMTLQIPSPSPLAGTYGAVPANVGTSIPTPSITASLVIYEDGVGESYDACEPATNGVTLNGNIAIIRRGTCNYVDKIVAAENEGAIAVIVVNNTGGAPLVMGGTDPGIGIPAVMVSMANGEAIIAEIEANGSMNGTIGDFGPFDYDSDFDNGIIAHEYGHGISNRLTGGGSNTNCLYNAEQMGEGWSDWFALILTMEPGDQGPDVRGIGTYTSGEPTTGPGIRPAPYSTDWAVNNYTYGNTNSASSITEPHGIGFIWCTMLWDLTWKLIDTYGYDPDIYNGTGGNNIAMHLIMNGMKLQPCSPGFVDGRDAILTADQMLYGGANQCIIWEVFANRGLGFSADQGDEDDREDQIAAFDLPPSIDHTTTVTSCQSYTWAENGQTYTSTGTYTAPVTPQFGCDSVATLYLTITNTISTSVSYINPVTLHANANVDTYQWLNCSDGMSIIPGENFQTFNASSNGIYAVVLTQGQCVDTSVCLLVNQVGLDEVNLANSFTLYPNPTTGKVTIDLANTAFENINLVVTNAIGKIVQRESYANASAIEFEITGQPGVYFVDLMTDGKLSAKLKVIKQ